MIGYPSIRNRHRQQSLVGQSARKRIIRWPHVRQTLLTDLMIIDIVVAHIGSSWIHLWYQISEMIGSFDGKRKERRAKKKRNMPVLFDILHLLSFITWLSLSFFEDDDGTFLSSTVARAVTTSRKANSFSTGAICCINADIIQSVLFLFSLSLSLSRVFLLLPHFSISVDDHVIVLLLILNNSTYFQPHDDQRRE